MVSFIILALDVYSIQVNSGVEASLSLVPRHQTRPKVVDFHTWLTVWNLYLQAMTFYHPHLIVPLIRYQSTITKFASQYDFSPWVTYDKLFRYQIANNQMLTWDRVDYDPQRCSFAHYVISAIILGISLLIAHCGNNHPLQPRILPQPSHRVALSCFPVTKSYVYL